MQAFLFSNPYWQESSIIAAMEKHTRSRLGFFFIIIGLFLLILFIGAVIGKGENKILLFLLSATALFFGYLLNKRPPSEEPSARFTAIRQSQERANKRRLAREEKSNARNRKNT